MLQESYQPVVLVILDGWGVAPPSIGNAITLAKTPNYDSFINNYPAFTLQASGEAVGLPWGEMGNSEVGHLSIGSGKILYQSLPRITRAISDGSFVKNKAFQSAFDHVKRNHSKLHLMGLVSDGGVHSYNEHLYALIETAVANEIKDVSIHAFLDGRDTPKNSGMGFVAQLAKVIQTVGAGRIATLSGRFYAMDRDNRWDRIQATYEAMVGGKGKQAVDSMQAVEESYHQGIFDEEFQPTVIMSGDMPTALVSDNDAVIYFNFRTDRARQLTKAFVLKELPGFERSRVCQNLFFVTMTEYEKGLPVTVAFPPEVISEPLAKVISDHGKKQVHLAETEKYAHVTFFFNGGIEKPFPGEEHVMVPSPRVASYAERPEMSAPEVTKKLLQFLDGGKHEFLVVNFANADMVAHTGDFKATVKAIEVLDGLLGRIAESVLQKRGVMIVTADHGNAEEVIKLKTGEVDKEHSTTPVPFLLIGQDWLGQGRAGSDADLSTSASVGVLADIAPTVLKLLGIPIPKEMSGNPLL